MQVVASLKSSEVISLISLASLLGYVGECLYPSSSLSSSLLYSLTGSSSCLTFSFHETVHILTAVYRRYGSLVVS